MKSPRNRISWSLLECSRNRKQPFGLGNTETASRESPTDYVAGIENSHLGKETTSRESPKDYVGGIENSHLG